MKVAWMLNTDWKQRGVYSQRNPASMGRTENISPILWQSTMPPSSPVQPSGWKLKAVETRRYLSSATVDEHGLHADARDTSKFCMSVYRMPAMEDNAGIQHQLWVIIENQADGVTLDGVVLRGFSEGPTERYRPAQIIRFEEAIKERNGTY